MLPTEAETRSPGDSETLQSAIVELPNVEKQQQQVAVAAAAVTAQDNTTTSAVKVAAAASDKSIKIASNASHQSTCSEFKIPSFRLIPTSEDEAPLQQLQVAISTQHLWALGKSSRDSHGAVGSTSLPNIHRIRSESVYFHFSYYNDKLHKTQVTQDFSCPFCSINCTNFEGLKCHLSACHDLFNFKYSVTNDVPDVYVSVNFDKWRPEIVGDGVDPREQSFIFSSESLRRRKSQTVVKYAKHAKHVSDLGSPTAVNELQHKTDEHIHKDSHCMQSVSESSSAPFARLQNQNRWHRLKAFIRRNARWLFGNHQA